MALSSDFRVCSIAFCNASGPDQHQEIVELRRWNNSTHLMESVRLLMPFPTQGFSIALPWQFSSVGDLD